MQLAALTLAIGIAINVAVIFLLLRFWWARRDRLLAKVALIFFSLAAVGGIQVVTQGYKQEPQLPYTYAMGLGVWQLIFYLSHRAISRHAKRKALREAGSIGSALTGAKLTIELPTGDRYEIKDLAAEETQAIIEKLTRGRSAASDQSMSSGQKGSVIAEVIVLGVPALISLFVVAIWGILIVKYGGLAKAPESLDAVTKLALAVFGYWSGMGGAQVLAKPKAITREELERLIQK